MKIVLAIVLLAALALGVAYWISPLHTFNTLVPKSSASARISSDIAFGNDPRQHLDIYAPVDNARLAQGQSLPNSNLTPE